MSMFHKEHYLEIARVISKQFMYEDERLSLAKSFADMLADDNELFDYGKFKQACLDGANRKEEHIQRR